MPKSLTQFTVASLALATLALTQNVALSAEAAPTKAKLEAYTIPITEKLDKSLLLLAGHYAESLTGHFEKMGIGFPVGTAFELNSEDNHIIILHYHWEASMTVMHLGRMMLELEKTDLPAEKAFKRFILISGGPSE